MIVAILKLLFIMFALFAVGFWIYALCEWDGTKPCKPEDCDSCPFPSPPHPTCEDRPINKETERKEKQ